MLRRTCYCVAGFLACAMSFTVLRLRVEGQR